MGEKPVGRLPSEVVSKALTAAQEWQFAQIPIDTSRNMQKEPPFTQTPTIPPGTILCNSDAAWDKNSESTGLGWIFTSP
ncbi:BnaC06g01540D [Brassica napus]|uniref:BnaC06g01540D protein n=3 Tax=Brassica TaxID=3705 RepID=A0A078G675_BRANA|nr:BnaC06g01540D [Brassica napus]VDD59917.1 unnamed protein product [Brassica oleracea]